MIMNAVIVFFSFSFPVWGVLFVSECSISGALQQYCDRKKYFSACGPSIQEERHLPLESALTIFTHRLLLIVLFFHRLWISRSFHHPPATHKALPAAVTPVVVSKPASPILSLFSASWRLLYTSIRKLCDLFFTYLTKCLRIANPADTAIDVSP